MQRWIVPEPGFEGNRQSADTIICIIGCWQDFTVTEEDGKLLVEFPEKEQYRFMSQAGRWGWVPVEVEVS